MIMNRQKKILLAEDDRLISRAYEACLKTEGFEVNAVFDGDEALAAIKNKTPDLILLDLIMPNKNGFEFLEEMRANSDWKKIPVIILSNLGQDSDIDRAKKMGTVDYLIKSDSSIQQVIDRVKKYLK